MIVGTHGFLASSGGSLPFEFTVKTDNAGVSTSTQFKLPLVSSLTLNAVVDWGDGNTDTITTFNQAETLHTYSSADTYTIKITGNILGWQFANGGDRLKMLNVATWGALNISVFAGFHGCTNLTCSATDAPLITTTDLINYFALCTNFNGNIGSWDVSGVTRFNSMFIFASAFNNGNSDSIKNWVINTTTDISFTAMFQSANAFNQPIGDWNVSRVNAFNSMFQNNLGFNNGGSSNINDWVINTTSTVNMTRMFQNATAFNQDIGAWNVSNVINFLEFMALKSAANYSAANLDSIYNGWSALPSVKPNLSISFGTIKYTAAGQAGKDILDDAPNNWTIVDGGI